MELIVGFAILFVLATLVLMWLGVGGFVWSATILGLFLMFLFAFGLAFKRWFFAFVVAFLICGVFVQGEKARVKHINDMQKEEVARREADAVKKALADKEAKRIAAENLRREKRMLIKEFALKESPSMWEIFQTLEAEIVNQRSQLDSIRRTLESFGRKVDDDKDYAMIKRRIDTLVAARTTFWQRMVQAYIQSCKFKASSGDAQQKKLCRNAIDNAVKEAESAKKRYQEMMGVNR
jgi:hypothetical protein